MLILTRRVGETLMIGDEVTVTVLGVKGNQVRIGVNAPRHIAVHREEIYDKIEKEKDNSSESQGFSITFNVFHFFVKIFNQNVELIEQHSIIQSSIGEMAEWLKALPC